jgi:hypothetical protein
MQIKEFLFERLKDLIKIPDLNKKSKDSRVARKGVFNLRDISTAVNSLFIMSKNCLEPKPTEMVDKIKRPRCFPISNITYNNHPLSR